MALLKIRTYPDGILRSTAVPVEEITREVRQLADNMAETMYDAPGIGLAANQVGKARRIIVVDIQKEGESTGLIRLINPEIVEARGKVVCEEGCLSVPEFYSEVKRAEEVRVRGLDLDGNIVEIEAKGLLAVALQHEIDHLNGKLFIDRLNPVKKEIFKRNWKKKKKKQV